MKQFKLILLIIALCSSNLFSQDTSLINKRFSIDAKYLFNQFKEGKVVFEDNSVTKAQLNYNIILEKIEFILNDTIKTLTNQDINYISINGLKFKKINDKYYQEIYKKDHLSLILNMKPIIENENKGAYNTGTNTASTTKLNRIEIANAHSQSSVNLSDSNSNEIKVLSKYYILINNKKLIIPSKRQILKISGIEKNIITNFIERNNIKFSDKNDLIKIIDFITTN